MEKAGGVLVSVDVSPILVTPAGIMKLLRMP